MKKGNRENAAKGIDTLGPTSKPIQEIVEGQWEAKRDYCCARSKQTLCTRAHSDTLSTQGWSEGEDNKGARVKTKHSSHVTDNMAKTHVNVSKLQARIALQNNEQEPNEQPSRLTAASDDHAFDRDERVNVFGIQLAHVHIAIQIECSHLNSGQSSADQSKE